MSDEEVFIGHKVEMIYFFLLVVLSLQWRGTVR